MKKGAAGAMVLLLVVRLMEASRMGAPLSREADAAVAEEALLSVAGVFVATSGAGAAARAPAAPGRRLTLFYNSSVAPELLIRVVLAGSVCALASGDHRGDGAAWQIRLLVDGVEVESVCEEVCECRFREAVSAGPHTLTARVVDALSFVVSQRQVLLRLVREGAQYAAGLRSADFVPDQASRASALIREYVELHRRIVDPADTGVAKRFLIVRSSHGLSNTQIEEVTGLLLAMATRRALILDFSNDTYTGQRPVMEYSWPLDIWMDAMSDVVPEGSEVEDLPRIPLEEYGKYGELLACADWNASLPGPLYLANTLFGYPTAYLNSHHAGWIQANFGEYVFPLLHNFLHIPSPAVAAIAAPNIHVMRSASCSVGLQIRWHHLRAYLDAWGFNHPQRTVGKFVACAASLCPLDEATVLFVATDFKFIRDVVRELLLSHMQRTHVDSARNLARSCGADGLQACDTWQSSTASNGVAARAVDGVRSGVWSDESCTHTWDDLSGVGSRDPTWMVDLLRSQEVVAVRLWQRADCCPERLHGISIYVGDEPSAFDNSLCAAGVDVRAADSAIVWCGDGGDRAETSPKGRYVFVVLPGDGKILTICEAEVYGRSSLSDSVAAGRIPRVQFLEPDDEVVTGERVMDAGDHETALADQLVLSQTDYIVTTRESTMGFVAHASVYKPFFQVSPYEETCRLVQPSQAGLVQDAARIHDEWPWSQHKYKKLSCAHNVSGGRERDVLLPV